MGKKSENNKVISKSNLFDELPDECIMDNLGDKYIEFNNIATRKMLVEENSVLSERLVQIDRAVRANLIRGNSLWIQNRLRSCRREIENGII